MPYQVFSDLMTHLGSCTAVLYNEGMHHHNILWCVLATAPNPHTPY